MDATRKIMRGDVFYVHIADSIGEEQSKARPGVIVSNDANNKNSGVVEVVYLTTKSKKELPTHVNTLATGIQSTVLCEQITSVSVNRLGDYLCRISSEDMKKIDHAMLVSLGIDRRSADKDTKTPESTTVVNISNTSDLVESALAVAERDIYKRLYEELLSKALKGV